MSAYKSFASAFKVRTRSYHLKDYDEGYRKGESYSEREERRHKEMMDKYYRDQMKPK